MCERRFSLRVIFVTVVCFILASPEGLSAQEKTSGFHISAQTAFFTGLKFPRYFYDGDGVPSEDGNSLSSNAGYGLALGYRSGGEVFWMGGEIGYSKANAPDGGEILHVRVLDAHGYFSRTEERPFTQKARIVSTADISLQFGAFPFRSLGLGFNVSFGVGYGRQSFTSGAVADIESRKFSIDDSDTNSRYDTYEQGGNWTDSSIVYVVGLGAEFMLSGRFGVRVDYRHVGGFYGVEGASAGTGLYYSGTTHYPYAIANRFTIGLNFHI